MRPSVRSSRISRSVPCDFVDCSVPSNADEEFANTFMGDGGARGTSFSPREVVAEVASSSILMVCTPVWRSTSTMKVSCELDT